MINFALLAGWLMNASLIITSPTFTANGDIPLKYSCEGNNMNPPLHIEGLPAGTKSMAIILYDPDAAVLGGFTHWVAFNIDPSADIPENFKGGVQASNGAKKIGYVGPCPRNGKHHYHFMVFALDAKLDLDKSAGKDELEKSMHPHLLAWGDLVGLYEKQSQ